MTLPSFTRHWMWFGTRGFETWIPMPASNSEMSRTGSESAWEGLNGGAGGSSSKSGHKVYNFAWNDSTADDLVPIVDYAEGVYDTQDGVNLLYFVTPDAALRNALPQNWAHPALAAEDGMPLWWDNRPDAIATAANPYRYPARTARYSAEGVSQRVYIPIPPGFSAWVGVHGSATGDAGVQVSPVVGDGVGAPVKIPMLSVINPQRMNTEFPNSSSCSGIELSMISTGLLRNLALNPSFETDLTGVDTFSGGGTSVVSRVAGGRFGSWCAQAQWTSPSTGAGGSIYEDIPVEAGRTYTLSGYVRTSIGQRLRARAVWKDATGSTVSSLAGNGVITTAGTAWSSAPQASVTGAAPAGAVSVRLTFESTVGTGYALWSTSSWLQIDGLQVTEGPTLLPYKDGNSTGWEWLGAVNNSVSKQTADLIQISGMMVQILPTGTLPEQGNWLSGQGHSGCQFLGSKPKFTVVSTGLDRVNVSAKLTETGAWI